MLPFNKSCKIIYIYIYIYKQGIRYRGENIAKGLPPFRKS